MLLRRITFSFLIFAFLLIAAFQSVALAFLLFGHTSQVFLVYVLVHGFRYCQVRGIVLTVVLCMMSVSPVCLVLWNWMDVNMNTIVLRLHPTSGSA